jgi:hypothetical protein
MRSVITERHRTLLLSGLLAGVLGGAVPANGAQLALFIRPGEGSIALPSGRSTNVILSPEAPPTESQREIERDLPKSDTVQFGEFVSTAPHIDQIGVGPTSAVLYLATHSQVMTDCAQVHVDVFRTGDTVRELLATATQTTTIGPAHPGGLTDPIQLPLTLVNGTWKLDPGNQLSLVLSVRNDCGEFRQARLLYDAVSQASRLVFRSALSVRLTAMRCAQVPNCDSPR